MYRYRTTNIIFSQLWIIPSDEISWNGLEKKEQFVYQKLLFGSGAVQLHHLWSTATQHWNKSCFLSTVIVIDHLSCLMVEGILEGGGHVEHVARRAMQHSLRLT